MTLGNYRALLVANSTFPNDPHNFPELRGPRNDPLLLRGALCNEHHGLFVEDDVRVVLDRVAAENMAEAEDFFYSATRVDTLLLYYTGHGRLDLNNQLFLCGQNSRIDRLLSTAIKASDLQAMIDASAAAATIIVLDCCHSGAFKGGGIAGRLTGRGRFVITSCRTGELANDAHAVDEASMFTHHLTRGLLGEAVDQDGDGYIDLDDTYRYVYNCLTSEGRQIPERRFAGIGDIPIARLRPTAKSARGDLGAIDVPAAESDFELSTTLIRLSNVAIGEKLPPERVAVINRSQHVLRWDVECDAQWVDVRTDERGLLLYVSPPAPGTNRANIHVYASDGLVKTIRLVITAVPPLLQRLPDPGTAVEMQVQYVGFIEDGKTPVLILREAGSQDRYLPIYCGTPEAQAIALAMTRIETPRPMTHDLAHYMLEAVGAHVARVVINELVDGSFGALILLQAADKYWAVASRPSDAVALAIRMGSRIFAEASVLDEAGRTGEPAVEVGDEGASYWSPSEPDKPVD